MIEHPIDRRGFVGAAGALGLCVLAGTPAAAAAPALPRMNVHRAPGCGCCVKWAEHARAAGFAVTVQDVADIKALKIRLGVPEQLAACHTTLIGDYVVEGHVPIEAVARMLRQRPRIRGIAVPGMPHGSPGMEHGGHSESFEVLAFDSAGKIRPFG